MQFPSNQSCCSSNPSVTGWGYSGCGSQYPIVPGSNPALQTWNGQNFVVADGSIQNPISLPFLKVVSGSPSFTVGANNFGVLSYYQYLTSDLNGDVIGPIPNNTVIKVNGGSIPVNKTIIGTNLSGQIVDASTATLSNNTTGNAATATNVPYSGLTGTVPTWNQNTTGNAATASNAFAGSTLGSLLPKAAANISAGGVVSGNIGTTITVPSYALGNFTVSCSSITTTSVIIITPKTIGSYAAFVNSQSSGQCQIVTYSGTSASLQPFSILIL